jgi:hypothetical protein
MAQRSIGLVVVAVGVATVVVGLLIITGGLSWFGRLPGDVRIEGEHTHIYVPITSMLLTSLGITVLLGLLGRLFH